MKASSGRRACYLLLFLAVSIFPLCLPCVSSAKTGGKTTMVSGCIEAVTFQAVEVRGNYYYFTGAPIVNEMGQAVPPGDLARGRMVKLYFRDGMLKEIMVYTHLLNQ